VFRSKPLEDEDRDTPWAAEIEQKVLSSPEVGTPTSSLHIQSTAFLNVLMQT
jgi:hypothetical protein